MPKSTEDRFSGENVCRVLMHYGYISEDQKQSVLKKERAVRSKLNAWSVRRTPRP